MYVRFRQESNRVQRVRHAETLVLATLSHLPRLHKVLHVRQAAAAVLGVQRSPLHKLVRLAAPQMADVLHVQRSAGVDEVVAGLSHALAQRGVARNGPQPHQRHALELARQASLRVVVAEARKRTGQRAGVAVGTKTHVHLEDALPLGLQHAQE